MPREREATLASLNAAQHCVTSITEARAVRVSQIHAELPQAQFLTLNLLGGLLLGAFLLTDLHNEQLEAVLFGAIAGVATVFRAVLADLATPFEGVWSIEPARFAARELLEVVRAEIATNCVYLDHLGPDPSRTHSRPVLDGDGMDRPVNPPRAAFPCPALPATSGHGKHP